ncbi:MAG: TetR/AcrR family transcriptional regulator [Clostridia bacterium]|nr:TetR/AcrR family transcriptional regulator [Clostridia bacterium]
MKNIYSDEGVRTRLILAALDELSYHGTADFSLRRVAISAQVSCAAPYRHFKSKEDLIVETARYITSKWSLLASEICAVRGSGSRELLSELATAAVKFWVANGNFRSLLMPAAGSPLAEEMRAFDTPITEAADAYLKARGKASEDADIFKRRILAVIYGTVLLASTGKLDPAQAASTVKSEILMII